MPRSLGVCVCVCFEESLPSWGCWFFSLVTWLPSTGPMFTMTTAEEPWFFFGGALQPLRSKCRCGTAVFRLPTGTRGQH